MKRLLLAALAAVLFALAPVDAPAQLEEEAARQIQLAREDLASGNYERAVNSASSALRLNPLLYEGLVIKGLAYEKLNETMLAYSLLVTYQELTRGMEQNPEVQPALDRLKRLIGATAESMTSMPAPAPVATAKSGAASGPAAQFEILSRKNQRDLFRDLNDVLAAGPAYVKFRSQSNDKGDDFYFGLATIAWDGDEPEIDDRIFTVILDSEKLVTKARGGGTLNFPEEGGEHEVQLWFDGSHMALRVDGEALGPFEARAPTSESKWFLALNDRARAWNLEVWGWEGELAGRGIPSGLGGKSSETTPIEFKDMSLGTTVTERTKMGDLPPTQDAAEVRVTFEVTCRDKGVVIVRVEDGREVILERDRLAVRGAAKMPRSPVGMRCDGSTEPVELVFLGDGGVTGLIDGAAVPLTYPGRKEPRDGEFRVKGDDVEVNGLVYRVGTRTKGRRVFRAERSE
mgnify:CR=1 FL=1